MSKIYDDEITVELTTIIKITGKRSNWNDELSAPFDRHMGKALLGILIPKNPDQHWAFIETEVLAVGVPEAEIIDYDIYLKGQPNSK